MKLSPYNFSKRFKAEIVYEAIVDWSGDEPEVIEGTQSDNYTVRIIADAENGRQLTEDMLYDKRALDRMRKEDLIKIILGEAPVAEGPDEEAAGASKEDAQPAKPNSKKPSAEAPKKPVNNARPAAKQETATDDYPDPDDFEDEVKEQPVGKKGPGRPLKKETKPADDGELFSDDDDDSPPPPKPKASTKKKEQSKNGKPAKQEPPDEDDGVEEDSDIIDADDDMGEFDGDFAEDDDDRAEDFGDDDDF